LTSHGLPVIVTLFLWWFSTGAILMINGLPRRTFPLSFALATLAALLALYGLKVTAADTSAAGAYIAFGAALTLWGWNEMAFLLGFVTGPRTAPCPPSAAGWTRFWLAVQTILYHEVALVASLGLVALLTVGGSNSTGLAAFVILWLMRLSAKINIFLGVPNTAEEFLPPHLTYLASYFRRSAMNLAFPVVVTLSICATLLLGIEAHSAETGSGLAVSATLLTTLLALAVLEHWFLVVPLPSSALWSWGLGAGRKSTMGEAEAQPLVPAPAAVHKPPVAFTEAVAGPVLSIPLPELRHAETTGGWR
jgi:putative photosynthetic complex assembly protein 2